MPSITDLARVFSSVTYIQQVLGLVIVVTLVVLVTDWRISLLALAFQYILVAMLLSTLIPLQIAAVRMIAGGLVALMFYITARRTQPRSRRQRTPSEPARQEFDEPLARGIFLTNLPFRVIGLALVSVSVIVVSGQFALLNAPILFWATGLWLIGGGLLTIAVTRDALKMGMGLLFFTSGFGIVYLSIDNSLLIYALLVISDLVIALAISHIASVPSTSEGRRRGEL